MTDTTAGEGVREASAYRDGLAHGFKLGLAGNEAEYDRQKAWRVAEIIEARTALAAQPSAGSQAWAGYCRLCGTARKVSPCHKCSVPLSPLMADHEEPDMPDIEKIRTLAAEVGYAIGVHGSMERDLDVIAAPWVETAVSAPELAAHLAKGLNAVLLNDKVQDKPCGRWSCCIQIDGWFKHIDLSVAFRPALSPPAEGEGRCASHKEHGIFNDPCCPHCEAPTPAPVDWAVVGPKLVEEREALRDMLVLILPLAKGYAAANRVGSNADYIQAADDLLAATQPQSNGE